MWVIDMGYGLDIPYRYGHPGCRYGIWANDMGDDSIDMVVFHIDMGCLVTLFPTRRAVRRARGAGKGLDSSTFQLNLSALYGIGGARRGCVARAKGVLGGI